MCGRFTLKTPASLIASLFDGLEVPQFTPSYNVAPTQTILATRDHDGQREIAAFHWGLVPSWAKDKKSAARMINARCETVREKPAYRSAFKRRRCLVLADGFFEWKKTPGGKQPYYFQLQSRGPFCFAGLWEQNNNLEQPLQSCTVITTGANPLVAAIHDRMPVILPEREFEAWLDPEFEDYDYLAKILQPYATDKMTATPVSKRVNKATYNAPDCIDPIGTQGQLEF